MITLNLYDGLAERYGASFELEVTSAPEAIRALATQLPGFQQEIEDGSWHLVRGNLDDEDFISEEKLDLQLRPGEHLHLMHELSGAGNGAFTAIIGIALIVAGVFTGGTTTALGVGLMAAGAGTLVGSIIQMTMKMPGADPSRSESADNRASFLFDGARNQSTQGVAIPRGYGRCRTGSIVVSVGMYAEDIAIT